MATALRSPCAFARLFAGKTRQILNNATDLGAKINQETQSVTTTRWYSNYANSPFVRKIKEQYEFEVLKNSLEWEYVQRLMPFETIPKIKPKDSYPSGWVPPKEEANTFPYFVPRTKNAEIPIYLNVTFRGQRKITIIKKIEGDIWLMNEEIKMYLKNKNNKYIETRVHEVGKFIETKGDYVYDLREWATSKGF